MTTYLKLTLRAAKHEWREKISNQNVSLLNLKLIDWIADVKNAREYQRNTKSIKGLIKKFPNIYQFCNGDLNKLVLLLRKEVYPYEYMDSWERFNVTSLPNIMDKDYNHAQKMFEEFGDYHGLYVQIDTLLLADVFEKFRDTCIEIYGLDPSHFLSALGLAWQACLKRQK